MFYGISNYVGYLIANYIYMCVCVCVCVCDLVNSLLVTTFLNKSLDLMFFHIVKRFQAFVFNNNDFI